MSNITRTNPEYAWRARTRSVLGEPELTSQDVATAAGVDLAQARRLWRALGFPPVPDDRPFFAASDAETLRAVQQLFSGGLLDPEVVVQLTRVTGQALARLAEAQVSALAERIERARAAGQLDVEPETALWAATEALVPAYEPFLNYVWRRHLLATAWRYGTAAEATAESSGALVVGFADLVGFTATTQELDEHELAAMVARFETLVFEHVPEHRGRVVKMIGDEVMFCTEQVGDAMEIALSLAAAHEHDATLPDIRIGLAMGPTLSWQGDLFGPTVNRASRVVNVARPGTVLLSEELVEPVRSAGDYTLRDIGGVRLRGIGKVRLSVVRRGRSGAPR